MGNCLFCGKEPKRSFYRYCSIKCQFEYIHKIYIEKWKNGNLGEARGLSVRNISRHIKRYLIAKYKDKCQICGWNEKNPKTGRVPLEVDHINGDSGDNREANLRLLCPNCHSLSPNYKNLNKGNGRIWRKNKYIRSRI